MDASIVTRVLSAVKAILRPFISFLLFQEDFKNMFPCGENL